MDKLVSRDGVGDRIAELEENLAKLDPTGQHCHFVLELQAIVDEIRKCVADA